MSGRKAIFRIALFLALSSAFTGNAEVSIGKVDVSKIPSLQEPGQAWERIGRHRFYIFEGLDVPLLSIEGSRRSWFIEDSQLREWPHEFPLANALTETVSLPDGTVIGGPTSNHLRYMRRKSVDAFATIPDAVDLYWSDYVEGLGIVFAKKSRNGRLLVFDGNGFLPSSIPEKGQTRQGEFLPWYSAALDGYFTAATGGLWFYRPGDQDWQPIKEQVNQSWTPSWGLFQRGSQDVLSPDGTILKVISENQLRLTQYQISDGYPTEILTAFSGHWNIVSDSGEIVGWRGFWHRNLLYAEDHEKTEELTPSFVRISPNSAVPEPFPNLRPLLLTYDENSISYQFDFANMPNTDRLYFLHENGFAYYANSEVSLLPEEWLTVVGELPRFHTSSHALYIAAKNGLFLVGKDDTLTALVDPLASAGFGSNNSVYDLDCDGFSIGFFGWKTGIYALEPTGGAALIMQSSAPIKAYGVMPDGKSILFSEKEGHLKILNVNC